VRNVGTMTRVRNVGAETRVWGRGCEDACAGRGCEDAGAGAWVRRPRRGDVGAETWAPRGGLRANAGLRLSKPVVDAGGWKVTLLV